jgi:23S rRNA (uracil1939-C5)-methyltransferase
MPAVGAPVRLRVEKPAVGGRMIGRLDGRIVLVSGAVPGERVTARVQRVGRGTIFAETASVDEPSPDRRPGFADPACGGCAYSHIAYPRQLTIKAEVIADALARIGRLEPPGPLRVVPSPEEGYRMRAKLHVQEGRIGFFREGTHEICAPRQTRQLLRATCETIDRLEEQLRSLAPGATGGIDLSESIDASQRIVCVNVSPGVDRPALRTLAGTDGLTGVGPEASVIDRLSIGGSPPVVLRRRVRGFFQNNRFLVHDLAAHVLGQVPADGLLVDLYAGTGLFAVLAAATRRARVTAVEGDPTAAADLAANAAECPDVEVRHQPVEVFLAQTHAPPAAAIVDPPRTGLTPEACQGVVRLRPRRIVYVSCDPATLARDSRRLADAGYAMCRLDAFDLFPNTPHVEAVAVFEG